MTLEDGIRHRLGTFRPSPTVMNMNEMQVSPPGRETEARQGLSLPVPAIPRGWEGAPSGEAGQP